MLDRELDAVRAACVNIRLREEWESVLAKFYDSDLPGCHPDGRMHKAQGSCA